VESSYYISENLEIEQMQSLAGRFELFSTYLVDSSSIAKVQVIQPIM